AFEERIVFGLVDADRPAQHDQQIGIDDLPGAEIIETGIAITNGKTALAQYGSKAAEVLDWNVPDGERGAGPHPTFLAALPPAEKPRRKPALRARPASRRPTDGGRCRARPASRSQRPESIPACARCPRDPRVRLTDRSGRDRRSPPWSSAS